jgi:DNA-directed RNA polymerase II subunit RPB11
MQLHRDNNVLFAGYKMPHPLEHKFVLKIQTTAHTTPSAVLDQCLQDLEKEFTQLEDRTRAQLSDFHRSQSMA